MALFKKKDKSKVPELPFLPSFPDEKIENKNLPSLPPNFNENFNRDMIKSAVNEDEPQFNESMIPSISPDSLPTQLQTQAPQIPNRVPPQIIQPQIPDRDIISPQNQELNLHPSYPPIRENVRVIEGPESVFVRIDKFRIAKKELEEAKKGLLEAENILKKFREIKIKEDNDLGEIDLGLESIKKKIEGIDSLIFDKV